MKLFSLFICSLFITLVLVPVLKRYAGDLNCVDIPGGRKIHSRPVPTVGGLAMAAGIMAALLIGGAGKPMLLPILAGSAIIVLFGFLDDAKGLGWRMKFAGQMAAALVVVGGGARLPFPEFMEGSLWAGPWLSVPLTLLFLVGVTNAVNLADGLDGLAGGLMLSCFAFLGLIAFQSGNHLVALAAAAAGGAILGFLPYNTHPAMVFMGDAGSQLLGFLAGALTLFLSQGNSQISPVLVLFIIGLPILDTLVVMCRRICKGKSPFHADQNHIHHHLLRMNFFHSEAVLILLLVQFGFAAMGYLFQARSDLFLLGLYLAMGTAIVACFRLVGRSGWRLSRPGTFDRVVKQWLRIHIKDNRLVTKSLRGVIEIGLPVLILLASIFSGPMPRRVYAYAGGMLVLLGLLPIIWPTQKHRAARLVIYLVMPVLIYYTASGMTPWFSFEGRILYRISFGVLLFAAFFVQKLSRRESLCPVSLFDYVLLAVGVAAVCVPFYLGNNYPLVAMGLKLAVIYFVLDVCARELHHRKIRLRAATAAALLIVLLKGVA